MNINNSAYQQLNNVGKTTATGDLQSLVEKGILKQSGSKEEEQNTNLDNWPVIAHTIQPSRSEVYPGSSSLQLSPAGPPPHPGNPALNAQG